MDYLPSTTTILLSSVAAIATILPTALFYRVVVPTNEVHIVQSGRRTISYGKDQPAGNSYYRWPAWLPLIGIRVTKFPVSVFDIQLRDYAAYDKGRVPFTIDIMAFFRIDKSDIAAQRVASFAELSAQLTGILQGACRSILATNPIEEILEKRAEYGQMFTDATNNQLKAWGVVNVKNIELMDVRDAKDSHVIANIMAMKQSLVERDSRVAVAANKQTAEIAEVNAQRAVAVQKQDAEQQVGIRIAEKEQAIGVAAQVAQQQVKEQENITTQKLMAVVSTNKVRTAEIERDVQVTLADQKKKVAVVESEGTKQQTITIAEGALGAQKLHAEGIRLEGEAKGAAETAVLLAPVTAQTTLAKEIGLNANYQTYLISIRQIDAAQIVGIEQAKALAAADIKVIAQSGTPPEGLSSVMDIFSAKGGQAVGAALEALKNMPTGAEVLRTATNGKLTGAPSK